MAKDSWGKVKNLLGLEIEDEYDDDEFEEEFEEEEVEERPVYKSKVKKDKGIAMTTATTAEKNSKVLVVEPVLFNDAPVICDNLKKNKTVVVNLEKADFEEGRKIFDFLNGAVYALDGTIQKISENVFILAPNTVDVIAESIDSSTTSDLLNWKFDK
ncbi:cell division inhibitor SepF [Alkalibaculum bacchi]|uniref:Cell division protein SepF n=1 Tax=Alkalibaculum bacchi TaxID=645887 RepID=A0A366IC62_9FIRM|nr:cell division protein SepF [Alkalibaculum bacchi]RBP68310.1 cell division inhibitor SepF [Alkalibaculum bacchi]